MVSFTYGGLASLSTELLYEILNQLSSLRDLYALIRASALFYRAFLSTKSSILSRILQNAIHPDVLPDVLAAARASEIVKLIRSRSQSEDDDELIRQRTIDFLNEYRAHPNNYQPANIDNQALLIPLCRLYSSVEFFLDDFTSKALSALQNPLLLPYGPHSCKSSSEIDSLDSLASLSTIERGRLQRAFFRFEIYRKVFHIAEEPRGLDPLFSEIEQADLFLPLFAPWEIEELACVNQYLMNTLESVFDGLEDDFVNAVLKAVASDSSSKTLERSHSVLSSTSNVHKERLGIFHDDWYVNEPTHCNPLSPLDSSYVGMKMLDWYSLNFFEKHQKKVHHKSHITALVSRGLPFLKCYLELDKQARTDLTLSTFTLHTRPSLHEILQDYHNELQQNDRRAQAEHQFDVDSLKACNYGWIWANKQRLRRGNYGLACRVDLMNRGYVFWDMGRLQESGILDTPCDIADRTFDPPPQGRDRRQMSSAEERLEGVRVRGEVLERLAFRKFWRPKDEYELVGDGLY